ncbi:MAG: undecaprenyl/decaprenyl-phosphate alpha-N-acetylglucosaminyl 1-phosphate transferase [Phycisphaerae bacterium]|nr:undecaprenyl/decaprenyl-phosphate alpha-N-acetylglucosaminyl 1-phosphate transferase [Phycisphaerae bacterium]
MTATVLQYIAVFATSLVLALLMTPAVVGFARRYRLYDPRGARKMHTSPTPRIGGIAIVIPMMAVAITAMLLPWFSGIFEGMGQKMVVLFATSGFIFLLGIVDDLRDIPAKVKLLGQIAAAIVVCGFGIRIDTIPQFDWMFGYMGWIVTIIWIVAITNAVNLIDGLDGLSAGISAAACAVIAGFAIYNGQVAMGILMLSLLGALLGFLVFNFNPAKIFMGDSGSMFLGFFLATASVVCATKVATVMGLVLPALALGLPIFDMILSVFRRVLDRRSVFAADRGHVHHRLVDMGIKHHHAVIIMYVVTLLAAGGGLLIMVLRDRGEILVVVIVLLTLLSLFRLTGVLRFRKIWNQVSENLARGREVKRERKDFESMQIHFRAAWTFDQWWQAVRRMARRMGFQKLVIHYRREDSREIQTLTYSRPSGDKKADEMMRLNIPVQQDADNHLVRVEIDVPIAEPLETIGRRLSLFGRLLDEHALPKDNENETQETQ